MENIESKIVAPPPEISGWKSSNWFSRHLVEDGQGLRASGLRGGREKRKEMNENRAKRGEAFRILRRNVNQACQEGERDRFDAGGGALASPLNNYKLLINDEGRS